MREHTWRREAETRRRIRPTLEVLEDRTTPSVADLSVTATHSPESTRVGDEVTFTYSLHNAGPDVAEYPHVEDHLPDNVDFVTFGQDTLGLYGGYSSAGMFIDVPNLAAGATRSFTMIVRANAAGSFSHTATTYHLLEMSSDIDPQTTNNSATDSGDVINGTAVWTGASDLSDLWSDAANWAGNHAPQAGGDVFFSSTSTRFTATNDFSIDTEFRSITLEGSGYKLDGARIKLGDGGLKVTGGDHKINFDIVEIGRKAGKGQQEYHIAAGAALEVSGAVSGPSDLEKTGLGALVLSGTNTYTGATQVEQGVLILRNSTALGSTEGGTEVFFDAKLELQNGITVVGEALTLDPSPADPCEGGEIISSGPEPAKWDGAIKLPGHGVFHVDAGSAFEVSGEISGPGGLHKEGDGRLILSGANKYADVTHVEQGVLILRNSTALGSAAGGTEVFFDAKLELQNGIIVVGEALTLDPSPADPCEGGEIISSGLAPAKWDGAIKLPGHGVFHVGVGAALEVSGEISGPGGLHKEGAGTLVLSAANKYADVTHVEQGVLILRNSAALGTTAGLTEVHGGTTLVLQGNIALQENLVLVGDPPGTQFPPVKFVSSGNNTVSGRIATNPMLDFTIADGSLNMTGVISGDDDLMKDGPGILVLSAANTYTGVTRVQEGVLKVRNNLALGSTAGLTELHGGTTLVLEGSVTLQENLNLVGDPPGAKLPGVRFVSFGDNSIRFGALTLNPALSISVPDGAFTIAGVISGNDDLVKDGPGTLVLTANNLLNGSITLLEGGLVVNGSQPNIPIILQGGSLGGTGLLGPITLNGGQIQGAVLQASPIHPGQRDLVAGGTAGNDSIHFSSAGCGGGVKVTINGVGQGTFAPTGRLVAYGLAGNDDIQVTGGLWQSAWLYGGLGNDRLYGGAGDSVLLGGDGNDTLHGRQGRDLLIGGRGADRIVGNADEDILIAGTTDFDANETALWSILHEWVRCDRSYSERAAHLRHGGGLNGSVVLTDHTVHDDGAVDRLTGSAGRDWFFANLDSGVRDVITDDHNKRA